MAINLRRALSDDDVEVPDHFEGVPLKGAVQMGGWFGGSILAALGIVLMVLSRGTVNEPLGAVGAAAGTIALVAVVRCRRFEIQIGRRWIIIGAGPLTRRIKRDLVTAYQMRPATGWRRLFADHEVVLTLRVGDYQHIAPTRNPEELQESLG